ncbi:PPE family protein [Mycolicibacterium porcinum]|nr:PPE family protein [Mycolicibacterium porcinum]
MVLAPPVPPTWFALPPEVNTARLMVGAGPAPMLQAAAGWEGLAILLETQADELAGALSNLTSVWSGAASERAVAATMPMIMWLRTMVLQAQKRALQANAQASSYSLALATTPPIPEIEQNHVTNAVLNATNFLGINTVPIGLNEMDYFVRMWNQAAGAMETYHAETTVNLLFEPFVPMKPIVIPGVGETTVAATLAGTAPRVAEGLMRNAVVEGISIMTTMESVKLAAGSVANQVAFAEERAVGAATKGEHASQQEQDPSNQQKNPLQQGMQMAMQMGSQAAQIPGQVMQMVQSPMQQLTQPLQQATQMVSQFSSMGSNNSGIQSGLMGATPFSNHPLAGGTGPSSGSGLVRATSLPGAGGSPPRTALLSSMLGISGDAKPAAMSGASGAAGPVAPVGSSGGGAPMTGAGKGKGKTEEKTKDALVAPTALTYDQTQNEDDDW